MTIARSLITVLAAVTLAGAAPSQPTQVSHDVQTEATRALANAFLDRYFLRHDFGAYAAFADANFIQHDPEMADGVAGHRAFFAKLFAAPKSDPGPPPPAHVVDLVLVDGDLFAVMHHNVAAGDKAKLYVDLWRVKDGRIAEHWDVIQPIPPSMPHSNGMGCGFETYAAAAARKDSLDHPACGAPDPKVDRADSLRQYRDYVDEVAKGDVLGAIDRWFHPSYRQHSPVIADGKQGAIDYLKREWGRPDAPKPILGPQRIVAEGDYVLVHYIYALEGQPKEAHVDIFRFKDGKISEHWDVKQPVPAESANTNGMW